MATAPATRTREHHPYAIGRVDDGRRPRRLRATYDAAQTTTENSSHWAAADALSANASHHPAVRATIRFRARYEYGNNTYCRGMLLTLAYDVVGTGPSLQVRHADRTAANDIERKWAAWARQIRLAEKLRVMRSTRARDGEVFGIRITNPRLRHPVKLDLRLLEGDQVATPAFGFSREQLTDGIVFDDWGNPLAYHVLKQHPGEASFFAGSSPMDYDTVPAEHVVHLFRSERPGQTRGVSEISPALPLFAQLRRYTLAVLAAAESAADLAGIIKSNLPPETETTETQDEEGGGPVGLEPHDLVEIVRRTLMVLPDGHDISQLRAEQPTTTYGDFKRAIISEISRCLNMPYNIAAADSSSYNYASGRLDHQEWDLSRRVDRHELEIEVLDWLFDQWLREATRIPGYLQIPDADGSIPHEWVWPGREHVDPLKEANAQEKRLRNLTTSHASEYAKEGKDWETEFEQIALEARRKKELGLVAVAASPTPPTSPPPGRDDDEEEEDEK